MSKLRSTNSHGFNSHNEGNQGYNGGNCERSVASSLPTGSDSFVSALGRLNGIALEDLEDLLSERRKMEEDKTKQVPKEIQTTKEEMKPRVVFPEDKPTVSTNHEITIHSTHSILPVRSQVLYRAEDGKNYPGIVDTVPTNYRPLYAVIDVKTNDFVEVPPDDFSIFLNPIPDVMEEPTAAAEKTPARIPSDSIAKEKISP